MLSEQQLSQLVKAIQSFSEPETNINTPRNLPINSIESMQFSPIIDYLLEPYEHGYWEFKAAWNSASPLAIYLLETLGTFDDLQNKIGTLSELSSSTVKDKLTKDQCAEILNLTSRLSTIYWLFFMAIKTSNGDKSPSLPKMYDWISRIDLIEFKSKFSDALSIFEKQIYFDDFNPRLAPSKLGLIKNGLIFILNGPRESRDLVIIGTRQTDVCTMKDFYTAIGVINDASVRRVFAPDEDLFRPYFSLVLNVLPHIIQNDEQISKVFKQALSYYEDDDFQHCISTLGLIAENYLQRIYTSLLREQISGGLTLGQTIDRIHKGIDELFPSSKNAQRNLDSAYQKITALDPAATVESIKPFLRELVAMIGDDRRHYGQRFDELHKPSARRTPFPSRINDNLNELLKWRNAASHNSRIPLGTHEADRTLYCLISLVSWWQVQVATMDWTKSKLEIIETLLSKAKTTPTK